MYILTELLLLAKMQSMCITSKKWQKQNNKIIGIRVTYQKIIEFFFLYLISFIDKKSLS
jgi:hypothetical protein